MKCNNISNIPSDIISTIVPFHPLFYNYSRKYTKLIVYNSHISSSTEITLDEFILLQNLYTCTYTDVLFNKPDKIFHHMITLFFECNAL